MNWVRTNVRTAALALLWCGLLVGPVQAGPKEDAEHRFRAGVALQKVEDFGAAIVEYEASLALHPTKSALFNLANCLRATHRYPEALDAFERLQESYGAELDPAMVEVISRHLGELASLTALLVVEVDREGAEVLVDGRHVGTTPLRGPLRLGLGDHLLEVSSPGFETVQERINLGPAERIERRISLEGAPLPRVDGPPPIVPARVWAFPEPARVPGHPTAPPAPRPRERRPDVLSAAAWVTIGVGGALLVGGSITGMRAMALDNDLSSACPGGRCPSDRAADIDRLERLALVTDVLLAAGGLASLGGVGLLVVTRSQREARRFMPTVAVGVPGASLRVRF